MNEFIEAIDRSVAVGNWYGALFVALSLPDICGKIDNPAENGSQRRYAAWFDRYIRPKYTHQAGLNSREEVFLSGNDCYALRCAYLHEGSDDTTCQRAREAVDRFHFLVAPRNCVIHCNMIDTKLQLQVDIFCEDIKQGVIDWIREIQNDGKKLAATQSLLKIQFLDSNNGIRI
ncbi:hypothetical protein [Methylomonas methanica]|uniref:Uncharacterized protein n=1 Tax=Methylomonas methanica TaxID=421 RepID=A0A177MMD6_METMH|nr:hypothetical protein [Methylomonas methanica]OAI06564.1 hypothetical protein A1332_11095 [Methylomonas methanica]